MNKRYFKYRDWQKRIIFEDAIYFITCKTNSNYSYFKEQIFCDLFIENLKLCKQIKGFLLFGWVLNYDHFHLLFQPNDKWNISNLMQFLKRHIARNINITMGLDKITRYTIRNLHHEGAIGINPEGINPEGINPEGAIGINPEGAIGQSHLQRKCLTNVVYKFDKFVWISKIRFHFKHGSRNPHPRYKWKKSFHDHYIRNNADFDYHMDYMACNPEKHHLPTDWPYVYTNQKFENLTDNIL